MIDYKTQLHEDITQLQQVTKRGEMPFDTSEWGYARKRCECGGMLIEDFKSAYTCNMCNYYEVNGQIITNCDGSSTREFVTEETVFYEGKPYKTARMEANVGDLVILDGSVNGKRIYKVKDFGGYETKSIVVGSDINVKYYTEYKVLVPLFKE